MQPSSPNVQSDGIQQVPFTDAHNQAYNTLREMMQQYHASGVPGMDAVVNTLNKTHLAQMPNYVPGTGQPQQSQATQQQQPEDPIARLNSLMEGVKQSAMPQSAQGYSA